MLGLPINSIQPAFEAADSAAPIRIKTMGRIKGAQALNRVVTTARAGEVAVNGVGSRRIYI